MKSKIALLVLAVAFMFSFVDSEAQNCLNGKRKKLSDGTHDCKWIGSECMKSCSPELE